MFDHNTFLEQVVTEVGSTEAVPIPAGEYLAFIDKKEVTSWPKKDLARKPHLKQPKKNEVARRAVPCPLKKQRKKSSPGSGRHRCPDFNQL